MSSAPAPALPLAKTKTSKGRLPTKSDSKFDSDSASQNVNSIKIRLKTWEHQFKASEGRLPNKADIKANPEIARMYSAYNSFRKHAEISESLPNPSSSNDVDSRVFTTPSRTNRTRKSTQAPRTSPQDSAKSPSKIVGGMNSPSKLRKSVHDLSSPRKVLGTHLASTKKTPNRRLGHQSPFDVDSGGGKGSPNLFADLLLESKKETPRTKARKFLSGIGSPLKPPQLPNSEKRSNLDHQSGAGGLSSFLRKTAKSPEKPPMEKNVFDDHDDDDEILGPSPFKPIANTVFQPLFDDPIDDHSDHHTLINSPSKSITAKWKITSSATPFISQSQAKSSKPDQSLQSAQREPAPAQAEKRKTLGLGIKRKRVGLGTGEEEREMFYENLPDPSKAQSSSITALNKKKRFQKSSQHPHQAEKVTRRKLGGGFQTMSLKKPIRSVQSTSHVLGEEGSESQDEPESVPTVPDLPFGNPDQSAVFTEFETFKFSRPTGNAENPENGKAEMTDKKGKGKMKAQLECTTTKPVKMGTQKVLVRAYRPIDPHKFQKTIDHSPSALLDAFNDDLQDNLHRSDDNEEEVEEEEGNQKLTSNLHANQDELEAEADVQISEELMNVLNIDDNLTVEGEDRTQLLRELRREEKVRRILEGGRPSIVERTLTGGATGSHAAAPTATKAAGKGKHPARHTKPPRPAPQATRNRQDPSDLPPEDEGLEFELGLDELNRQEQIECQINGDDDDWEDEPLGWKTSERLGDFAVDDDDQ